MKILGRLRWLPPVVLAAIGGVMLAVRTHEGEAVRSGGEMSPPAAQPRNASGNKPSNDLSLGAAPVPLSEPESEPKGEPEAEPASETADFDQLERQREALVQRAGDDPEAALQALLSLDNGQRGYLHEDVIRRAAEQAPDRTLAWLQNNVADEAARERLLTAAYAGIARQDPTFAMNEAQALAGDEARRLAVGQVLEAWADEDPVAAFEWARSSTGDDSGDLLATVMRPYTEAHPRQAGDLIAGLPAGPARDRLVDGYVHELAGSDPQAAMSWLSQLGEETSAHSAMAAIFDQWAQDDPLEALDYLAANVEGEASFELVGRVAAEVGATQPDALSGSLDRLPEPHRALAAEKLALTWASNHSRQARAWAEALPEGELKDSAIRGIVKTAKYQAPEEALALARLVSEPSERAALVRDVEAQSEATAAARQDGEDGGGGGS